MNAIVALSAVTAICCAAMSGACAWLTLRTRSELAAAKEEVDAKDRLVASLDHKIAALDRELAAHRELGTAQEAMIGELRKRPGKDGDLSAYGTIW